MSEQKSASHLLTGQPMLFTSSQLENLAGRGITTVEQFLALYHTASGPKGFTALLQLESEALKALVAEAENIVGDKEAARLRAPVSSNPMGLNLTAAPSEEAEVLTDNPVDQEPVEQKPTADSGDPGEKP